MDTEDNNNKSELYWGHHRGGELGAPVSLVTHYITEAGEVTELPGGASPMLGSNRDEIPVTCTIGSYHSTPVPAFGGNLFCKDYSTFDQLSPAM